MQYSLFLAFLFALPSLAGAQSELVVRLANQVCRCMETTDRAAPPEEQARDCVRLVGLRHKRELLQKMSLDPENPVELTLLSERLADLLSRNCPILSTLSLNDFERELRWSDRNTARKADAEDLRYKFPKNPLADPSGQSVSEPPQVWRFTGSIVGRPGRGSLRLRLPDGKTMSLEYPAAVSRRANIVEGQTVIAVCIREWRKSENGGVIALVVQSIE